MIPNGVFNELRAATVSGEGSESKPYVNESAVPVVSLRCRARYAGGLAEAKVSDKIPMRVCCRVVIATGEFGNRRRSVVHVVQIIRISSGTLRPMTIHMRWPWFFSAVADAKAGLGAGSACGRSVEHGRCAMDHLRLRLASAI